MPVIALLGMLGFAGVSFFFALAETALFTLGKWKTRELAAGDRAGRTVARLMAEPQDLLGTLVLGNALANTGLLALGVWLVVRWHWAAWPTLTGLLFVVLVGGEVIPKTLAVRVPEFWALRVAVPMAWFHRLSRPVRQVAQDLNARLLRLAVPASFKPATAATEADYQELIEIACQQGTLAQVEKEIILQILSLDRRTAREVMRPRAQMVCLPDDLSVEEMMAAARRARHHRLPLYDETPDTIVGVLNTRTLLLDPQVDLAEAIEFPSFVPESINLLKLFQSLQRQQRGLAIVLDEFGGTAGLVTMADILGAMIGRIRAEGEPQGFVCEKLGEGRWRTSGTMRLEDFRREYPALGEVPEVDTLGGLLVGQAEVVPLQGHSAVFRGLRLTATVADERRVKELLVETVKKGGTA